MKLTTTTAAPETKVAAAAIIGYAVSLLIQILAAYVPHFHAPPATLVALLVTTLSAVAGWLAPHTNRPVTPVLAAPVRAAPVLFSGRVPPHIAGADVLTQPAAAPATASATVPPAEQKDTTP